MPKHSRRALVGVLLGLAACASSEGGDETGTGTGTDSESGETDSPSSSGTSTSNATSTASSTSTSSSGTSTSTTASATSDGTEGGGDTTSTGGEETTDGGFAGPGCPADLPAGWILCEDFETVGAPTTYFGNFWTSADLMGVEDAGGLEGSRALRVGHDPDIFSSGMADIRFGRGPTGGMVHDPEGQHREVWVRFMLRTSDTWPDAGIAEAVEVMSVAGNARAIAVDATIYSPVQAEAQAIAWSCVHDSQLDCNGTGDWSNPSLAAIDVGLGSTELYGAAAAGTWQCHEVHVRLDDPGESDGLFEVFVDGNLEVALDGLEFVNAWADAELNQVRFSSFWNAPADLDHYIDDVVVSTTPVGCG